MSEAYVSWLFDLLSGPAFAAVAVVGMSAFALVFPSMFKEISERR